MTGVCISNRLPSRGYAVVALDHPKFGGNIGAAMRAAFCYDARLVVIAGQRFRREQPDTPQAWRHIPTLEVAEVMDALPYDCIPVAVDLLPGATPLPKFVHPERAFYIFGAEDRTLDHEIVSRCPHKVVVPDAHVHESRGDRQRHSLRPRGQARARCSIGNRLETRLDCSGFLSPGAAFRASASLE